MRVIKFRVWIPLANRFAGKGEYVISMDGYIGQEDYAYEGIRWVKNVPYEGEVDLIISQFTGLKDKNGIDIYEGDLILSDHWNSDKHLLVQWDKDSCKFYASLPSGRNCIDMDWAEKVVVGNIFEGIC